MVPVVKEIDLPGKVTEDVTLTSSNVVDLGLVNILHFKIPGRNVSVLGEVKDAQDEDNVVVVY